MLFRYPGGKKKTSRQIVEIFGDYYAAGDRSHYEYREPFFGAGAVGFEVLDRVGLQRAWFNDRDPAICCVWERVLRNPQGLQALLCEFVPSVTSFHAFKDELEAIVRFEDIADRSLVQGYRTMKG